MQKTQKEESLEDEEMQSNCKLPVQIRIRIWRESVKKLLKQKGGSFSVTCNHNRIRARIKCIGHLLLM